MNDEISRNSGRANTLNFKNPSDRSQPTCPYCNCNFLTQAGLDFHLQSYCTKMVGIDVNKNNRGYGRNFNSSYGKQQPTQFNNNKNASAAGSHFKSGISIAKSYSNDLSVNRYDKNEIMRTTSMEFKNDLSDSTSKQPLTRMEIPVTSATLYFGGELKKYSLLGGCSWMVTDDSGRMVTHGYTHIQTSFPSLLRIEYQGLLNGLRAALLKNIKHLIISSHSELLIKQLLHSKNNTTNTTFYFHTVYEKVKDLYPSLIKYLQRLDSYELKLVNEQDNLFSKNLAEKAILLFDEKRLLDIDKACQLNKSSSSSSTTNTTATITNTSASATADKVNQANTNTASSTITTVTNSQTSNNINIETSTNKQSSRREIDRTQLYDRYNINSIQSTITNHYDIMNVNSGSSSNICNLNSNYPPSMTSTHEFKQFKYKSDTTDDIYQYI